MYIKTSNSFRISHFVQYLQSLFSNYLFEMWTILEYSVGRQKNIHNILNAINETSVIIIGTIIMSNNSSNSLICIGYGSKNNIIY